LGVLGREDRRFYLALLAAIACHGLLLAGITSSRSRQLGDPSGSDSGISVELVTEADLRGRAAVAERGAGLPVPSPGAAEQQQQQAIAEQPQPVQQASEPFQDAPAPAKPSASEATQASRQEPAPDRKAAADLPSSIFQPVPGLSPETPDAGKQSRTGAQASEPQPKRAKQAENAVKPTQPKRPQTRTTMLDLTLPKPSFTPTFTSLSGRGGAGVERPPGITRSGENDDFAKGVIRALQRTMPQLTDTFGRVTVRITLDRNGSLVGTRVMRPSHVAGLDQSVVFSTQQASFPFPPKNAVAADLVFIVTYVYR
jgi:TonB family protein